MKIDIPNIIFQPLTLSITLESEDELRELAYRIKCDLAVVHNNIVRGTSLPEIEKDNTQELYKQLRIAMEARGMPI